jgi:hypothetical protein
MNTPYTTKSGLQIGCNYQPPVKPWTPTHTEAMLQDALLAHEKKRIDWDGIWIVLGCIAIVCAAYALAYWSAM